MADHINISNPDCDERAFRHRLEVAMVKAELDVTRSERDHYRTQLEAIHTRIGRGEEFWLDINGERVVVRAATEEPQQ